MAVELPAQYDPKAIEERVSRFWLEGGFFHADPARGGKPYTIVIPPPNVTGALHMGHALDNTLQDVLIRWHRMLGINTLWMPGTDHAGIATQNVVERKLAEEGRSRDDLGRDKFVEEVWKWKEQYGSRIINQLKRLGASCDWERERFTMDEGLSRAVRLAFCTLYKRGLIYKGNYIINWCPRCLTALADDEVDHESHEGHLWHIFYPYEDDPSEGVVVATTRPETMLGDTAVAVNPKDERYKDRIGRMLILPIVERRIPIIADEFVDMEFGTGAVKVTPAHDPNDFAMGRRHKLAEICVFNENGTMNENAGGAYNGMDRFECREALIEELKEKKLLRKVDPHQHSVGHCYRCHSVVEPYISEQWFVKMRPLADAAIKATEDGRVKFHPERWTKFYLSWLENVRDWCISRQIWWGHRIPAWECQDCAHIEVATEDVTACPKCGSTMLVQDEDVLDTWFSSSLWPFSTMGWPDRTPELDFYYPTSVLVTDRGIIFFWVARMVMMGLELMEKEPFHDVYIHATILDELGRKMSKSLGNGIDPLVMIEGGEQMYMGRKFECDGYGADGLRFSLVILTKEGQDVRVSPSKLELGRNFVNKLWNASRFVFMNLEEISQAEPSAPSFEDAWILSRAHSTIRAVTNNIAEYLFNDAATALYDFVWRDFCDWYLELSKPRMNAGEGGATPADRRRVQETLSETLNILVHLLHPVTPFVTEHIWGLLKEFAAELPVAGKMTAPALVRSSCPAADESLIDAGIERDMASIQDIVRAVRSVRREKNLRDREPLRIAISVANPEDKARLDAKSAVIRNIAFLSEAAEIAVNMPKPTRCAVCVVGDIQVFVHLEGLVDAEAERARLDKQRESLEGRIGKAKAKLSNENFVSKAPEDVVAKERERVAELEAELQKVMQNLRDLD
ncbi:MAG TPA: valine--tRNA ligase [Candidatus Brocadiia bacterium]|nr:valine--tRNA ligase [Candidatus Brocadiia bacterium]